MSIPNRTYDIDVATHGCNILVLPLDMLRTVLPIAVGIALTMIVGPRAGARQNLLAGWHYAVGDASERVHADAMRMPSATQAVSLPHRVDEPNRALWYRRALTVPRGMALLVDADDGAQVFADGARLPHYRQWFFLPESSVSTHEIVVRVLNNAMQGGLRSVTLVPADGIVRESLDVSPLPEGFAPVETSSFRARMPAAGEPCRFTAWADSQGGWTEFRKLVALMVPRRSHFSVGAGDLVDDGSDARAWRSFVDVLRPLALEMPVVPVVGNHDYDGSYNDLRPRHYMDLFRPDGSSWFAWSCGPARFAAIDMNSEFPIGISSDGPQYRALMNEVRSAPWTEARWRVLIVHQPPWSRSWRGYDGDESVRRIVTLLTASHGLDLVISGHSHAYERLTRTVQGRPLHVLITGGAGGALEEPQPLEPGNGDVMLLKHHFVDVAATTNAMSFEAVGTEGSSIDRWRITR
jgi:hypothetical protein